VKVNPNYKEVNVKKALKDPNSVYHYCKKLIQLRKENPVMVYGTFHDYSKNDPYIYAYTRELDGVIYAPSQSAHHL
jgi:oligo-1,6-glucosidase